MRNHRPFPEGCRPRPARRWSFAFAALVFAAGMLARAAPAAAQVSPGPLAGAHGGLEGNRACFQCHPPAGARDAMENRCLACHGEIAALRAARRGLHARVAERACAKCHPDHGGREFQLVVFDEGSSEKFDHSRAGYRLEGAHARAACRSCHQPKNQKAGVVAAMKVKDRSRSWLGLGPACASCHGDPHRGQLGLDCARCHGNAAWKPAVRFSHSQTSYPLTGKHAVVPCARCHLATAGSTGAAGTTVGATGAAGATSTTDITSTTGATVPAGSMTQWKPVTHGECSSCHRDPHAGRFGAACAKCHVTDDFHRINSSGFDHSLTRYPLQGAHAAVACAKCHDATSAWGPKPAFARCDQCHRDAHAGQVTAAKATAGAAIAPGRDATASAPAARDCASCHDVRGFRPSTFALAAHQGTGYPLEGAHARAECGTCHAKATATAVASLGPARVPLHPKSAICTDCHGDPHRGRFAPGGARPRNENCVGCHSMEQFSPSRVDARAHSAFRFALGGAHLAVPCAACHRELGSAGASPAAASPRTAAGAESSRSPALRTLEFSDERRHCADCHTSPHGDQFLQHKDHGACENCHGADAFKPASRFDHSRDSAFPLDGRHAKVPCAFCHAPVKDAAGTRTLYRPISSRCESCHATR